MPSMARRVASMKVDKISLLGRRASKEVKTMPMFVRGMSYEKGTGGGAERLRGESTICFVAGVEQEGRAWS